MQGGTDLYNGSLAADLLADIREAGGLLTQQDLQAFRNIHSYTHTRLKHEFISVAESIDPVRVQASFKVGLKGGIILL
jgi:hypothetical protein